MQAIDNFSDGESPPISAAAISRAPFAEQLSRLISITLPNPDDIESLSRGNGNSSPGRPLANKPINSTSPIIGTFDGSDTRVPSPTDAILSQISSAVDKVLYYFKAARTVLSGLDAEDNVEWIYEGRQAVFDVGSTILRAGDIMTQMMSVLEQTKSTASDNEQGPETKPNAKVYIPVIDKIELAIKEWHEILDLVRYLRLQVDISTEWKDLYEQILTEVSDEIDRCATSIFEIQEKLHSNPDTKNIDIDALITVMDESPYMGRIKLPSLSESERDLNRGYLELHSRVKPLRASLDFVPLRIEHYSQKANEIFPSSVTTLHKKSLELETKFNIISKDIDSLEKELGDERWKSIFRKTGQKAVEMLNTLQENLNIISNEQQKARQGDKIDRAKMDRCATKNGYLMPAIARHISIIDRAIRDRFSVTSEMYTVQAALHRQWNSLVLLAETRAVVDDELGEGEGSPCSRHGGHVNSNSIDTSVSAGFSHYSGTNSPLSSPATSPSPSTGGNGRLSLNFHHKNTSVIENGPVRGLAIKFPVPHKRKASVSSAPLVSNHSMTSSTSSITSTKSESTVASSLPSSPAPSTSHLREKEIASDILLSPSHSASTKDTTVTSNTLSSSSPSLITTSPSFSHTYSSQIAVSKGRNSQLSMRQSLSPKISFQPLPNPIKQSQIPILSPERRSSSRASFGTPSSRPSSRLESRHSLATPYPELQTPSKIPRPSSRLSDMGPSTISSVNSRTSSIGMTSMPRTPALDTSRRIFSRGQMTPIPSTPGLENSASRLPRPSSRLDTIPSLHSPDSSTLSRVINRRVSSSVINQSSTYQSTGRSLDRKVSLPGHLHQINSIARRRTITPIEMNRPGSATKSRIVPPVPSKPPWR